MTLAVGQRVTSKWWDGSGVITQLFGVWETAAGINAPHTGIDIGIPSGTPLRAAQDATVWKALGGSTGFGNHVVLQLADGTRVLFGHMSDIHVAQGQTVHAGDLLGHSGSTGASTGPHLHFEEDRGSTPVDPTALLEGAVSAGSPPPPSGASEQSPPTPGGQSQTLGLPNPIDVANGLGNFFGHLVTRDHDPCHPPADEGIPFQALDWVSCPAHRWQVLFVTLGVVFIMGGFGLYFFKSEDAEKAAAQVVKAAA